jgi:ribosomal protein S18 acetylase RimI-like enzyme
MIDGAQFEIVPNAPGLRLRLASPADEPFIRHLFREVRTAQFAATGLSGPILEQVIAQQFRSQTAGYAAQFPDAISLIIMQNATAIGRLLLHCTNERWHIIDIALLSADRGLGFGTAIFDALETSAKNQSTKALTLSVLGGNLAARRFYLRRGFAEIGPEGAVHIAMRKHFGESAMR